MPKHTSIQNIHENAQISDLQSFFFYPPVNTGGFAHQAFKGCAIITGIIQICAKAQT